MKHAETQGEINLNCSLKLWYDKKTDGNDCK